MSTPCTIVLKIDDKDKGKILTHKPTADYTQHQVFLGETPCEHPCPQIQIGQHDYIGAYVHWDGFPQSAGLSLLENHKDYENVLNLILGGDMSALDHALILPADTSDPAKMEFTDYSAYYMTRPSMLTGFLDDMEPQLSNNLSDYIFTCYTYLFENNKWYYLYQDTKTLKIKKKRLTMKLCGEPIE